MEINLLGERKTLLIKVDGELDHHLAAQIREEADRKMRSSNAVNVVFDLSEMTFMDSSGIGVMMGRYKKARALGGKTVAYGINAQTLRIMKMSGVDKIIKLTSGFDKAMRLLDKSREESYNG